MYTVNLFYCQGVIFCYMWELWGGGGVGVGVGVGSSDTRDLDLHPEFSVRQKNFSPRPFPNLKQALPEPNTTQTLIMFLLQEWIL